MGLTADTKMLVLFSIFATNRENGANQINFIAAEWMSADHESDMRDSCEQWDVYAKIPYITSNRIFVGLLFVYCRNLRHGSGDDNMC